MKRLLERVRESSVQTISWNSRRRFRAFLALFLAALFVLTGCATSPVASPDIQVADIGPAHVLAGQGEKGARVVWGGQIVDVRNLAEHTEISMVSYPLDNADRPLTYAEPGVRFLIRQTGFMEPVKFAPGRFLTVLGTVQGIEESRVDAFLLSQPALMAESIHLWPVDMRRWSERTRFSIGVGITL